MKLFKNLTGIALSMCGVITFDYALLHSGSDMNVVGSSMLAVAGVAALYLGLDIMDSFKRAGDGQH